MGAKSQFNRVVYILEAIQSGRCPTAVQIADEYEVSERTVRRDIEWLRDFHNAPIVYDRSRGGYRLTDPTYRLPALSLSEGELLAITVGEQVLTAYRNSPWHTALQQAFERIEALLPDQVTLSAQLFSAKVAVITPPVSTIAPEIWAPVLDATRGTCALVIHYLSTRDRQAHRRTVHPYRLVAHDGSWYLIGWSVHHQAVRIFSLARIRRAVLGSERFTVPEDFDIRAYIDPEFGVHNRSVEGTRTIRIRFDAPVRHLVEERTWHSSQSLHDLPDGGVELQFRTNQTDQVLYRVMSFGPAAEIMEPAELRAAAASWAANLHRRYGGQHSV